MLEYLTVWFMGGFMLSCVYLLTLETVEKQHFLGCANRYRTARLYRWIYLTFEDKRTESGVDELMIAAIGPFPPLLGFLELLIRRARRSAPFGHGLLS